MKKQNLAIDLYLCSLIGSTFVCYRYLFMRENHHGIYDVEMDIRTCVPTPLINIKYHFSTHSKQYSNLFSTTQCVYARHSFLSKVGTVSFY